MKVTTICAVLIGLGCLMFAVPVDAAKPPEGSTYFTVFFGLDEPYALGSSCFLFEESAFCSHDGELCGSWIWQDGPAREAGFSFGLSFLEEGRPVRLSGEARIDTRGSRSSIAGTGLIEQASGKENFSFAGRAVEASRCLELLEEAPDAGDETTIVGSGNVASEDRDVDNFHGVVAAGVGRVKIRHGSSESLTITADDNLLPYLTSEVRDGLLFIGVDPAIRFRTQNDIVYDVTVRSLDEITVSGVMAVDARGISGDLLTVTVVGVSAVVTGGAIDRQVLVLEGVSIYDGSDLQSRLTEVAITGICRATVRVSEALTGKVAGPSTLSYIGSPRVSVTKSGGAVVTRVGG